MLYGIAVRLGEIELNGNGNHSWTNSSARQSGRSTVYSIRGCSVPVVLRKQWRRNIQSHWQLVGEAYVHGFMDGEKIFPLSPAMDECAEIEFEIR